MATSKTVVKQVSQKQDSGGLGQQIDIGVDFNSVIDTRAGKGNHSLSQFYDNYTNFMNGYTFISRGSSQPQNKRALIWIDTSKSNQDSLG